MLGTIMVLRAAQPVPLRIFHAYYHPYLVGMFIRTFLNGVYLLISEYCLRWIFFGDEAMKLMKGEAWSLSP
ncbi:hypothetical protein M378DRAFT_872734 [Amanita muscaria Koide BX008]|uniref:Uncharacterized protein n=1 Tax=Amanita muscaria (strain Koide BX008) TaxID=946122 RepID=A0A0C2WC56_AMAMK|nr:hypothetical protein M378DRAFT_872734 [Amanita muscaria Koide BX008]